LYREFIGNYIGYIGYIGYKQIYGISWNMHLLRVSELAAGASVSQEKVSPEMLTREWGYMGV